MDSLAISGCGSAGYLVPKVLREEQALLAYEHSKHRAGYEPERNSNRYASKEVPGRGSRGQSYMDGRSLPICHAQDTTLCSDLHYLSSRSQSLRSAPIRDLTEPLAQAEHPTRAVPGGTNRA